MVETLNWLADAALAFAVLSVSWFALLGWNRERRARRRHDVERRIDEESAKTFYAIAAIQRPIVIIAAFGGSALKLGVLAEIAIRAWLAN